MADASTSIEQGIRFERSGSLHRALKAYQTAAQAGQEPEHLAEAHRRIADAHRGLCNWGDAIVAARRSAEIAESAGLATLFAEALNAEALVYQSRGDFLPAIALYERMLSIATSDRIQGIAHQNLGSIAAAQGELEAAERHFLGSYRSFQQAAYLRGVAIALINYARITLDRGDLKGGTELCARAVEASQAVEDLELVALATMNYAEALARSGELGRSESLAVAALGYFSIMENPWRRVECLRLLGDLRRDQGFVDTAVQCYSQGLATAESLGAALEAAQLKERLQALPPVS